MPEDVRVLAVYDDDEHGQCWGVQHEDGSISTLRGVTMQPLRDPLARELTQEEWEQGFVRMECVKLDGL